MHFSLIKVITKLGLSGFPRGDAVTVNKDVVREKNGEGRAMEGAAGECLVGTRSRGHGLGSV